MHACSYLIALVQGMSFQNPSVLNSAQLSNLPPLGSLPLQKALISSGKGDNVPFLL